MDETGKKQEIQVEVSAEVVSEMAKIANRMLDIDEEYISVTTMMAIVKAGKFMIKHGEFGCIMNIPGDASVVISDMLRLGFRHTNGYFESMNN